MEFAIIDGARRTPFSGGRGACPTCGALVIAKCGSRVMHHWAHAGKRDCDPWWENETEWHRAWKNLFPEDCREINHIASDGEIHRADIKTPGGIVIEVQHSQMSDLERNSRESFYGNLIWIVDGRGFQKNFDIYHMLPAPNAVISEDLIWAKATRQMQGAAQGLFFRLSEARRDYPDKKITKTSVRFGQIHSIREIENSVESAYVGHHQYDWVRPRRTWLEASCPVYIDFGREYLARLEIYDDSSGLSCIRLVGKRDFISSVLVEKRALDVLPNVPSSYAEAARTGAGGAQ